MAAAEQHKVVVVVDDEPQIVAIVCEVLEEENIRAVACDYGVKSLGCIYEERPALVVLDVQMPGMDGIQIFEKLRAEPETAVTPVIFLTANSHIVTERLPNYHEQNAVLVPKPFDLNRFVDLVHRLLPQP
jgi:two-component system, LuxR family, sensor kinase FixL